MNYYEKYIKYKTKYLNLHEKYGGANPGEPPAKISRLKLLGNTLVPLKLARLPVQPVQPVQPVASSDQRNEISKIIDNLYLGNCYNAINSDKCQILKDLNIQAILNITTDKDTKCKYLLDDDYLQLPLLDLAIVDISLVFDQAFQFIESKISAGRSVYVHCQEGISRSATIVIMYLMRKNKSTFQSTLDYIKSKRGCIDPNLGFVLKLMDEEKRLRNIYGDLNLFTLP
jgi:hypothetical protein